MSTRGFSRRDLLQMGGRLVMTVGAAKVVIALPGCGGDSGSVDAPPHPIDGGYGYDAYPTADAAYHYATLDDCHSIGTYDYPISYPGYTYHYYLQNTYGCPAYVPYAGYGVYCYYIPGFVPGYDYACWTGSYEIPTTP